MNSSYIILSLISMIFASYVMACAYRYLSNADLKLNLKTIIVIIIHTVLITANGLYNNIYLSLPTTILITMLFFYLLFNNRFYKILITSIYISILSLFVELVLSIALLLITENLINLNVEHITTKAVFSVVCFIVFYYVSHISGLKIFYIKLLGVLKQNRTLIILIYMLFGIIGCFCIIYAIDFEKILIYISSILAIILLSLCGYFFLNEKHANQTLNLKNKYLLHNQLLFKNSLDDYKMLKHNLLNDFLFIQGLCPEEIQNIITEKISKYRINTRIFVDIDNVPEGLQGLIYVKYNVAKESGIDFYIDSDMEIGKWDFNKKTYVNLFDTMGIILDNAIEASRESECKAIYLSIRDSEDEAIIELVNTFTNNIDLEEIGGKNYSTKNRNTGLGLYYIENLNPNIRINKEIVHNLFRTTIVVKK